MFYKANSINILMSEYEKGRLTNLSKRMHSNTDIGLDKSKNLSPKLNRKKLNKLKQDI